MADYMTKHKKPVVSFFFARGHSDRNTEEKLWPTIAFQIAMSNKKIRKRVGKIVLENPDVFHKSLATQLRTLVVEPLRSLGSSLLPRLQKRFLCIIDGLDECRTDDEQCTILASISEVVKEHHLPVQFLIASRPEPHIRHSFEAPDLRPWCYSVCLDDSFQPVHDVYLFLRDGFDTTCDEHPALATTPRPWPSNS
jgi:NACHT domain